MIAIGNYIGRNSGSWNSGWNTLNPTNLVASPYNTTRIDLTWTDIFSGKAKIAIYRSVDNSSFSLIATTSRGATSYSDTSCSADTVYYYKVRAEEGSNYSGYSNMASGYTWFPTSLDNKQGWWRADNVVSSATLVSQANDMLGGTKHATNSTDGTKPILVSEYGGNQPALHYPKEAYHFLDFSNISLTDLTIHLVYKMDGNTNNYNQLMYGQSDGVLKGGLWSGGITAGVDGFGGINSALNAVRECNNETFDMKVATITNSKIYINGVEATYTDTGTINAMILSRLGARVGSGQTTSFFQGYICECIVASSVHSEADILKFHTYGAHRYNIKLPTVTDSTGDKHIDFINGQYQFGYSTTKLYYSSDYGVSFTEYTFANAGTIESSVVFSNGNVYFTQLNKNYRSIDGLTTVTEVIVLDKNGNPYTAQNNLGQTNSSYYKKSADLNIFTVSVNGVDKEMVMWGNYANVLPTEDDCPINIYRMFDDCIPKILYAFGVNPAYPDAGDVTNEVICRHVHNIAYNPDVDEWIVTTGDEAGARPWLRGTYDDATDTATFTVITNSPTILYTVNTAGVFYLDGYLYFSTDTGADIMRRCLWADVEDATKHELLMKAPTGVFLYNMRLKSSGEGIATGEGMIFTTQNFFRNYLAHTIDGYAGDFLKLSVPVGNVYKVEKYTPPAYATNSIYITITPN